MTTKEKIKKEIDKLSTPDAQKVYHYVSTLNKKKTPKTEIRSLKLKGKLDSENVKALAYE